MIFVIILYTFCLYTCTNNIANAINIIFDKCKYIITNTVFTYIKTQIPYLLLFIKYNIT